MTKFLFLHIALTQVCPEKASQSGSRQHARQTVELGEKTERLKSVTHTAAEESKSIQFQPMLSEPLCSQAPTVTTQKDTPSLQSDLLSQPKIEGQNASANFRSYFLLNVYHFNKLARADFTT